MNRTDNSTMFRSRYVSRRNRSLKQLTRINCLREKQLRSFQNLFERKLIKINTLPILVSHASFLKLLISRSSLKIFVPYFPKKIRSDDRKNMLRVQIFGLSLTSILIILGVLWWFQWFPFGSSSVDGEDYYMQNTALLANNMLAMEYEMVNDDQDVNVHKQLRETALATAVLLKKV